MPTNKQNHQKTKKKKKNQKQKPLKYLRGARDDALKTILVKHKNEHYKQMHAQTAKGGPRRNELKRLRKHDNKLFNELKEFQFLDPENKHIYNKYIVE